MNKTQSLRRNNEGGSGIKQQKYTLVAEKLLKIETEAVRRREMIMGYWAESKILILKSRY